MQAGLGIEEGLAGIAAGHGGDVDDVARVGQELAQQGGDVFGGRRLDFIELEAGLEADHEVFDGAVAGADDGATIGQVIHEGEEPDLGDLRDGVGFLDPDDFVTAEQVAIPEGLGDLFDALDFNLGAVEFGGGPFGVGAQEGDEIFGEGTFADARVAIEEDLDGGVVVGLGVADGVLEDASDRGGAADKVVRALGGVEGW